MAVYPLIPFTASHMAVTMGYSLLVLIMFILFILNILNLFIMYSVCLLSIVHETILAYLT